MKRHSCETCKLMPTSSSWSVTDWWHESPCLCSCVCFNGFSINVLFKMHNDVCRCMCGTKNVTFQHKERKKNRERHEHVFSENISLKYAWFLLFHQELFEKTNKNPPETFRKREKETHSHDKALGKGTCVPHLASFQYDFYMLYGKTVFVVIIIT